MGDLTSSLFAQSFLKNFVLNLGEMPLFEDADKVYSGAHPNDLYRRKVLAQALAESFMARFEPQKLANSSALIKATLEKYPDYLAYADINLLHTLSFMKDVAFFMNLGALTTFDPEIEQIGKKLLAEEPNNPYLHAYMGTYYDRLGMADEARFHFQRIVDLENFNPSWYTEEAQYWLQANHN